MSPAWPRRSAMSATSTESLNSAEEMIFEFERDFAGSLRCVPMAVRFKLDQCGVKPSLKHEAMEPLQPRRTRQAHRLLLHVDRRDRRLSQCPRSSHRDARGKPAALLSVEDEPTGAERNCAPDWIAAYSAKFGLPAPSPAAWRALSPLQRFALFKLTQPSHDNDNFVPAMLEFGLFDGRTESDHTPRNRS